MRLHDINGPEVEIEDAIHNPGLIAPRLDFIVPHQHLLDVFLLQAVVLVVQEVDECETRLADGVETFGKREKIDKVGADAAFVFHVTTEQTELIIIKNDLFKCEVGVDDSSYQIVIHYTIEVE